MYSLPLAKRITIRSPSKALRTMIARIDDRWQGDRVSVVIGEAFTVSIGSIIGGYVKGYRIDLRTGLTVLNEPYVELRGRAGATNIQPRANPEYGYVGTVPPGTALMVTKRARDWRANERSADLTFYFVGLTDARDEQDQLDVARDAVLAKDLKRGEELARKTVPKCYPLFIALVCKESSMLDAKIATTAAV